MPNWCNNTLCVRGEKKEIKAFDEQFKKPFKEYRSVNDFLNQEEFEEKYLSKDHLSPEERGWIDYKVTGERSLTPGANEYDPLTDKVALKLKKAFDEPVEEDKRFTVFAIKSEEMVEDCYSFNNFIPISREDFLEDWYMWRVNNWGTKWDVGSEIYPSGLDFLEDDVEASDIEVVYHFDTAWSPPIPVFQAMAEQHPDLELELLFSEGGMCFAGKIIMKGTEVIYRADDDGDYYRFLKEELDDDSIIECHSCTGFFPEWQCEEMEEGLCPLCEKPYEITPLKEEDYALYS